MSNDIAEKKIYSSKFYNYYSDDHYTLYNIQEFYYPYFKIQCNCIFREKNKISNVEESFLEAIKCGIKDFASLEKFLAIDKDIFEVIASKLHIKNLFIEEPLLVLTKLGKKVLADGIQLKSVESEESIILDAITGDTSNEYFKSEKENASKNINSLKVQVPYPKNETLHRKINNKALQTILFEAIKNKNKENKEIVELKEIVESPHKLHKRYFALFFKNKKNPRKILIIKDGHPDDNMTNIINNLEKQGKNLFGDYNDGITSF